LVETGITRITWRAKNARCFCIEWQRDAKLQKKHRFRD